jgi:hypothetical protein
LISAFQLACSPAASSTSARTSPSIRYQALASGAGDLGGTRLGCKSYHFANVVRAGQPA